ncbi:MAG: MmgE/PrpD family protein [Betaproteobacteria bacterium]|nr:MmgE/PrpD family protein [Betaproteobacteria bacterium]
MTAAGMAQFGFTGADTIFEGERGFLRAFTDKSDASRLVAGLDRPYPLEIEFKPYSCARPIHNAIDCALEIRNRHQPALDAIKHIEMARHPDWAHYHQNKTPKTYHEAQVSLPYSIAVALKEGQALLKQFSDRKLKDPVLRRISDLTDFTVDAALPRGVSCRMKMTMSDGRRFEAQVDYPKGSIRNPMSNDELRAKFDSLAGPVLGAARAAQLAERVGAVDKCGDIGELMRLAAKPRLAARGKKKSSARADQ